jgi:hypothetical protein
MTERLAPPDPYPGMIDRIAAWHPGAPGGDGRRDRAVSRA